MGVGRGVHAHRGRSGLAVGERSVRINGNGSDSEQGAVDGGAADTEQLGQLGGAVGAEIGEFEQILGLVGGEFRLLPAEMSTPGQN